MERWGESKRKQKKEITIDICDKCLTYQAHEFCHNCGLALCRDCRDEHAKLFRHSAQVFGSEDGLYCNNCQSLLEKEKDPKFLLYLEMEKLIRDFSNYGKEFREKAAGIELKINNL